MMHTLPYAYIQNNETSHLKSMLKLSAIMTLLSIILSLIDFIMFSRMHAYNNFYYD